jgi:hypothetical protein
VFFNEITHQVFTPGVTEHHHLDASTSKKVLFANERAVFANDHAWDSVKQDGAGTHATWATFATKWSKRRGRKGKQAKGIKRIGIMTHSTSYARAVKKIKNKKNTLLTSEWCTVYV